MAAALTVWLDFNEHYRKKQNSRLQPLWVRSIACFVALTYSFTIGYSRIFLGAHSWNELAFGWQLGVWLACTIFFCYKDSLFYRLEQLNKGLDSKVQPFVVWGIVTFVLVFSMECMNYWIMKPRTADDP